MKKSEKRFLISVMNIYDDLLVYGKTKIEHDIALQKLLQRLREIGLTANIDKCIFGVNVIDFFGMKFSSKDMGPDPCKIEALKNAEA